MANIDKPKGFYPLGDSPRHPYTASAAVEKGDALLIAAGEIDVYAEGAGNKVLGVAAEDIAADATGLVWDDPHQEFVGQCSGTYAETANGTTSDIEGATGEMEVNEDATVNETVTIKRHYDGEVGSAEVGEFSRVVFIFAQHVLS